MLYKCTENSAPENVHVDCPVLEKRRTLPWAFGLNGDSARRLAAPGCSREIERAMRITREPAQAWSDITTSTLKPENATIHPAKVSNQNHECSDYCDHRCARSTTVRGVLGRFLLFFSHGRGFS